MDEPSISNVWAVAFLLFLLYTWWTFDKPIFAIALLVLLFPYLFIVLIHPLFYPRRRYAVHPQKTLVETYVKENGIPFWPKIIPGLNDLWEGIQPAVGDLIRVEEIPPGVKIQYWRKNWLVREAGRELSGDATTVWEFTYQYFKPLAKRLWVPKLVYPTGFGTVSEGGADPKYPTSGGS